MNYPVIDSNLSRITESTPIYRGVLLLPGEAKKVGCGSQVITGTSAKVNYTYSVAGAYYPEPDVNFPVEADVRTYIRSIERPGFTGDPATCIVESPRPTGHYFIRNSHPSKAMQVDVTGLLGSPSIGRYTLNPEEVSHAGCNNNTLRVVGAKFLP